MNDKHPFINVTEKGENCTIEDCVFIGDRPTVKTAAKNTRLIRVKHLGKTIKDHPYRSGIILIVIGLIIENVWKIIF